MLGGWPAIETQEPRCDSQKVDDDPWLRDEMHARAKDITSKKTCPFRSFAV